MGTFNQGVIISFYGIGITFLVLIVVILLIKLILFIFNPKVRTVLPQTDTADPNIPHVAAFAAAWWLKRRNGSPSLGERLENPPGKWWDKTAN